MNVIDAAYNVVHDYQGGSDSLGPRIGKNATTLSHEVARVGTAKLGLDTAVKVSVMTGDRRILEAFALQCDCMVLPLPSALMLSDDACMVRLGELLRESSDVVRETTNSLADGHINQNEMGRIERECGLLVRSVASFLQAAKARHLAGQPGATQGGGV